MAHGPGVAMSAVYRVMGEHCFVCQQPLPDDNVRLVTPTGSVFLCDPWCQDFFLIHQEQIEQPNKRCNPLELIRPRSLQ
jgi:hypothetical protein